jgi:hypothetical protein
VPFQDPSVHGLTPIGSLPTAKSIDWHLICDILTFK